MRLLVSNFSLGNWAAHYVCDKINQFNPTESNPFILGLPTGSTPLEMYKQLIKFNQQNLLSFKHVVTFNMDEYVGLAEDHPESYHYYMHNNFFKHIDIDPKNINILNGNATYLDYECKIYEEKIASYGGMNLILGGVGEDGHIAFNEPGSSLNSVTRVKTLNYSTILANSRFFDNNPDKTPNLALTMGIKTVLDAQEVLILAKGLNKAVAISHAIEGAISSMCPVTALQLHRNAAIVCDEYAAFELKLKTIRYFENLKDEYDALERKLANMGSTL
jgi:glucosamine-6-phosphate deaminase